MQFDITPEKLTDLLTAAAEAHHKYEADLGHPDEHWQQWYSSYILTKLIGELWLTKDQPQLDLSKLLTSDISLSGDQIVEILDEINKYPIRDVPVDALPIMKMVLDCVMVIRSLARDNILLQKQIKQFQDNYAAH